MSEDMEDGEGQEKERSTEERICLRHQQYKKQKQSLLTRLAVCSVFALLLLIYEGLPALGIELPGIMNREDYFFSYVLMGLQLVVFCALSAYREIWEGAKKLFSRYADTYSIFVALASTTLIYDVSLLFYDGDLILPTFHFALACVIVLAILRELQEITTEKRIFEFYLSDILDEGQEEQRQKKIFTLCKSGGKNSIAEKMYAGGFDSSKNLYFPIETDNAIGFFSASKKKSTKRELPMLMIIPSIAFSLFVGIFAFVASGSAHIAFGGMLLTLLLSMPTLAALTSWLPFERLSAKAQNEGFAFASEGCMESYGDCTAVLFSDTLVFSKCSPANVNLALYDATSKDVLLGCLSALYCEIGGPMADVFSAAKNEKLGACRIKRIAKSGVEAIVGSNYSVLLGSELFMSRYGIAFPNAVLSNSNDEVFTLCVSINGRASARIAVRYAINEMFPMFLCRLAEDGIECAVETFDPMIRTELLKRLMPEYKIPMSIVHLNAHDYILKREKNSDKMMFEATGGEMGVSARHSRLNLHVALSAAKRMIKLRKILNMLAIAFSSVGALIALAAAGFGWIEGFAELYVMLYWILGAFAAFVITLKLLPSKQRYSYELYLLERQEEEND